MPAATMTYDSLVQDIKDYLERGDANDATVLRQIPRIINNTERTLADMLKILGYLGAYTSTMQTGVPVIAKPQNWRATVSINFGDGEDRNRRTTLRPRSVEYLRAIYPTDTEVGAPIFYADYTLENWLVGPSPSDDYPFEAMIYQLPDLLSAENQQNYLTKYAPFLLLYSCLAAMEPFLINDSRLAVWKQLAKENFDAINAEDLRRMVDRGQLRSTT
jgi:hypothetical protein